MNLALASAVSAAVVLAAPFMGQLNAWLRRSAPEQYLAVIITAVSALVLLGIVSAVRHIRERRVLRYGAIAAALVFAAAYSLATATGSRDVDWVERVHLVEYGAIAFLFYRAWRDAGDPSFVILPAMAGLFVGLAEEWLQWFIPVRVGELHDVLLNLVAVSCGLVFSVAADPPGSFSWRFSPTSRRRLAVMGSLVTLGFAFFVDQVHRGHVIERADIGVFRSHYTVEELGALARDRTARWQHQPPTTFTRLSREDQYMDEGLWHVRRRNLVGEKEAWTENRILEEFYAPVLDTPSYTSLTGHRWTAEQRGNAEAAALADPKVIVSAAQPYPIYAVPRWWLWGAAGILGAALVTYGWWPQRTQRTPS